jgi:hypothetical protein
MFSNAETKANNREGWGYSFQWTDKHVDQDEQAKLRAQHGERGAEALQRL